MGSKIKGLNKFHSEAEVSYPSPESSDGADINLNVFSSKQKLSSDASTLKKKFKLKELSVKIPKLDLLNPKGFKEQPNSLSNRPTFLGPKKKKMRLDKSKHTERNIELLPKTEDFEDTSDSEHNYTKPEYLEEDLENVQLGLIKQNNDVKSYHTLNPNKMSKNGQDLDSSIHNQSISSNTMPKTGDKITDLLIPADINQYGECLKTRLGRSHYGLTLSDPPDQFFQGVLKGASGQTLAVNFGDVNLINKIDTLPKEEIGHFIMDTSFKVSPMSTVGVNHILTINILIQNQSIPLWFAITSCSSPELYKRILIEFQQHCLDWPFLSVLLNDDPDLCKGILAVFPDIDFYGSWFYYCHSIWNELTINNLITECKTNPAMMLAVKMLMVVPYLPHDSEDLSPLEMADGFDVVRQFTENNELPVEFHAVLDYVATFWFNTIKSINFTVFGKHTRAVNYVEVFQIALLSFMKHNGNVWTLTRCFQKVAKSANAEVNKYLNGKGFSAKKSKARKYNVQIRDNTKKLLTGQYDVETFLKMSTAYCEEIVDIFLHSLYTTKISEKHRYTHVDGWIIRIK